MVSVKVCLELCLTLLNRIHHGCLLCFVAALGFQIHGKEAS